MTGLEDADSPTIVDQPVAVNGSPAPLVKLTWDNGEVNELAGAALVGRDVALDEAVLSGELAPLVPGGQNDSMSRVHAEVRPSRGDIVVVDRGSTNGTFVNGHRLQSGQPFFVMELVNGVPITDYCDANHLTLRQRLELFVPVCQAVRHLCLGRRRQGLAAPLTR